MQLVQKYFWLMHFFLSNRYQEKNCVRSRTLCLVKYINIRCRNLYWGPLSEPLDTKFREGLDIPGYTGYTIVHTGEIRTFFFKSLSRKELREVPYFAFSKVH